MSLISPFLAFTNVLHILISENDKTGKVSNFNAACFVQKTMKSQANYSQLEREFGVYEDDSGVLRCKGQIANADLPLETKFPALLPKTTIFQPCW